MELQTVDQYRALVEHSTDVVALLDEAGVVRFVSPSVERTLGYAPNEVVGEPAFELIHPADRERVVDAFAKIVDSPGGSTERQEHRNRHADGSWVWVESVTTNLVDSPLEGYVVNTRDVSERKEWERELDEEHEKYSTLVEQSSDGIAIIRDGVFAFVNPMFLEITGYDEHEVIGAPFVELVAPEDRDLVRQRYDQRLDVESEPPPSQYETRFLKKGGETRVVEISASVIDYEGQLADLATIRDVTERKRHEERLVELTTQLEVLNRIVRHDIRNDMNVIMGWAQMLEEHVEDPGRDPLEKLLTSARHVVELTDISRDYLEALTSEDALEVEPTSLRSILSAELTLRRDAFPEAEFVVPDEIPDVAVAADEMLGSVFRNLLNNAVQHNDAGQPVVELSVAVRDDEVDVTIADNGPGIPDARKDEIFGKGNRGLASPGTGIGLYLVRTLVSQYGGSVWVEDNEPTGAEFHVRLPRFN